jgi:hypothetical protein
MEFTKEDWSSCVSKIICETATIYSGKVVQTQNFSLQVGGRVVGLKLGLYDLWLILKLCCRNSSPKYSAFGKSLCT